MVGARYWGKGENGELGFNGGRVSFLQDFLEVDGSDGSTL